MRSCLHSYQWWGFLDQWPESMSAPTILVVSSVLVAQVEKELMCLPTQLQTDNSETVDTNMLLDSEAGRVFINKKFAKEQGYPLIQLSWLIRCKNVDGTPNKLGTINYVTTLWLDVHGKRLQTQFLVTRLGQEKQSSVCHGWGRLTPISTGAKECSSSGNQKL